MSKFRRQTNHYFIRRPHRFSRAEKAHERWLSIYIISINAFSRTFPSQCSSQLKSVAIYTRGRSEGIEQAWMSVTQEKWKALFFEHCWIHFPNEWVHRCSELWNIFFFITLRSSKLQAADSRRRKTEAVILHEMYHRPNRSATKEEMIISANLNDREFTVHIWLWATRSNQIAYRTGRSIPWSWRVLRKMHSSPVIISRRKSLIVNLCSIHEPGDSNDISSNHAWSISRNSRAWW
jgi:hypothetical protein